MLGTCPECDGPLSSYAVRCPRCGYREPEYEPTPEPAPEPLSWWWLVGMVIVATVIVQVVT
jgi:hypothetical protein